MRCTALFVACAAVAIPVPSSAQSDAARALIGLLRSAADNARSRRDESSVQVQQRDLTLSLPLRYQSASGPIDPAKRFDPRNLDVAGVRLGMTPPEAARAMSAAGYSDSGIESDQPSYQQDIQSEWSRLNDTPLPRPIPVAKDRYWQRGKQRVTVTYLALPEGPVANEIAYTTEDATLTPAAFVAQVRAKYGTPVNDDPTDMRWCTVKAPACEDVRSAEHPILAAWVDNRSIFLIGNDPARAEALDARRAADIASRTPRPPEAAF